MLGFCYLVFALTFDREIHRLCEKSGFILQTSRGKKFEMFFVCLAFFVCQTIYYLTAVSRWNMPQVWMVNATFHEDACSERFMTVANYKLGLNETFNLTASLFFIVGMVFGQSYSVQYVKPLLWVYTPWPKKLLRTLLGLAVTVSIYAAFWYMVKDSSIYSTRFFFGFAAPALFISFFMFGLFPIVCKYIGLVRKFAPDLGSSMKSRAKLRDESRIMGQQ
jgi:hypothetical protein